MKRDQLGRAARALHAEAPDHGPKHLESHLSGLGDVRDLTTARLHSLASTAGLWSTRVLSPASQLLRSVYFEILHGLSNEKEAGVPLLPAAQPTARQVTWQTLLSGLSPAAPTLTAAAGWEEMVWKGASPPADGRSHGEPGCLGDVLTNLQDGPSRGAGTTSHHSALGGLIQELAGRLCACQCCPGDGGRPALCWDVGATTMSFHVAQLPSIVGRALPRQQGISLLPTLARILGTGLLPSCSRTCCGRSPCRALDPREDTAQHSAQAHQTQAGPRLAGTGVAAETAAKLFLLILWVPLPLTCHILIQGIKLIFELKHDVKQKSGSHLDTTGC